MTLTAVHSALIQMWWSLAAKGLFVRRKRQRHTCMEVSVVVEALSGLKDKIGNNGVNKGMLRRNLMLSALGSSLHGTRWQRSGKTRALLRLIYGIFGEKR